MTRPASEAGLLSRGLALMLDIGFITLGTAAVAWLTEAAASMLPTIRFVERWMVELLPSATAFFLGLVYFVGGWALLGTTLGKALLGLRVTGPDGRRPSLQRALVRYLMYGVSAAPLLLGFLWVLVDAHRRTWHDLIAGTAVVRERSPARREMRLRRA